MVVLYLTSQSDMAFKNLTPRGGKSTEKYTKVKVSLFPKN